MLWAFKFYLRRITLSLLFLSFLVWAPPYEIHHEEIARQTQEALYLRGDRGLLNFLPYSTNVPLIFAQAKPYIQALGLDPKLLDQPQSRNIHSIEYLSSVDLDAAEPENKHNFVFEIQDSFESLPNAFYKASFIESLNFLNQHHRQEFFFKSKEMAHAFFYLAPFLYNEQGLALYDNIEIAQQKVFEKISQMTASQLRELYLRPFATHTLSRHSLNPLFDLIFTSEELDHRNEFIERFYNYRDNVSEKAIPTYMYFRPRRQLRSAKIKIKPDFLALTEVSPYEALLRGEWAGDCSSESLAYYALHPKVKVFKLSNATKNADGIQGYVFVLEIEFEGKVYPYILTMNAKFANKLHVALATEVIADLYDVDSVLLPHFSDDFRMTDNAEVKALYSSAESKNVQLTLPPDWFKIDALQNEFKSLAHANPYDGLRLQEARLVRMSELVAGSQVRVLRKVSSKLSSATQIPAPELMRFSRALLAHQHALATGESSEEALRFYNSSENDLRELKVLLLDSAPTAKDIESSINGLGIEADHLRAFPVQRQLLLFSVLLKNDSPLLKQNKWLKAAKSALVLAEKIGGALSQDVEYSIVTGCLAKLRGE